MFATLPRLLLATLLACCGLLLTQPAAFAGTGKDADRADLVFSGTVTEVSGSGKKASYAVMADRIWKGTLTRPAVDVERASGDCALRLEADTSYVFFVSEEGRDLVSSSCAGTTADSGRLERRLDSLLGESQPVAAPEPEQQPAEFTLVEGAEPESFTRLAAPGAALVLIGLLGLVFFGRAARRSA